MWKKGNWGTGLVNNLGGRTVHLFEKFFGHMGHNSPTRNGVNNSPVQCSHFGLQLPTLGNFFT